jgi:hypothetical protein
VVFAGAASAWRIEPAPVTRLFGGPLRAELSIETPTNKPAGWGVGARVGFGREGWVAGGVVAGPPVRIWRYQVEPQGDVGVGSTGAWQAGVSGVVRRWR